jgi:hypothetical protein
MQSKDPFHLVFVAALTWVATVGVACGSSGSGVAAKSCVAPSLTTSPTSVRVGEPMKVSGQWFWAECNDVVMRGNQPSPNAPVETVRLVLQTNGGHRFDLGMAHPDSSGSFTVTITVPDGARPGAAQIKDKAGLGSPAKIILRA